MTPSRGPLAVAALFVPLLVVPPVLADSPPTAPDAPWGVVATWTPDQRVRVSWQEPLRDGGAEILGYVIAGQAVDDAVIAYYVTAFNEAGESPPSAPGVAAVSGPCVSIVIGPIPPEIVVDRDCLPVPPIVCLRLVDICI